MSTESAGFPDEPTFNLAALAGQEQLQERIPFAGFTRRVVVP